MDNLFYSFNQYLREIFGERVQRLSLNAGFGCPNIDGTLSRRGCFYCNNRAFSVYVRRNLKNLREQIKDSIEYYRKKKNAKLFIAYFQSFTNTYGEVSLLKRAWDVFKEFPQIVGLFISTRPDCIDEEKLAVISDYKKEGYLTWIEYGVQTTHNRILELMNRNHTYEDFLSALALTRKYEIDVGVHLIIGLPLQSYKDVIKDAYNLASLDIKGIKFHVLHILKGTELENWFREGKLRLLKRSEYVKMICDFLEIIPPHFVILRLVSSADSNYLIAPSWIGQKHTVIEEIKQELKRRGTFQGFRYKIKEKVLE